MAYGRINRDDCPRHTIITFWQRPWIRGKNDPLRLISSELRAQLSEEAECVMGLLPRPVTYTYLRDMTPKQIAALTLEEKKVLGFTLYE